MIVFNGVDKEFIAQSGAVLSVLSGIDLTVGVGEFLCLLGPSGCGKTTMLNLAAGFIAPSRGRVLFDNSPVRGPGPERGVVFQDATLFPWLTVEENVRFGLRLRGVKGRKLRERALRHLEMIGLAGHAGHYPHTLSGGMRQRVAIARVLALEPPVMLMDEPFSALDANSRERLQEELVRLWLLHRRTVLYVTHSVDEAAWLADRVVILGNGIKGLHADIINPLPRPRHRCSPAFMAMKQELRAALAQLPCCIQPLGHV